MGQHLHCEAELYLSSTIYAVVVTVVVMGVDSWEGAAGTLAPRLLKCTVQPMQQV